jgi:predicted RNA-binding protein YlqC (UPF0109 family)
MSTLGTANESATTANLLLGVLQRVIPSPSPASISVEMIRNAEGRTIVVYMPAESLAYVAQNKGRLERSLRTLVAAVSMKTGDRFHLAFRQVPG